ncbi:axin interactor, dorsalization-associated protein isoform X1 [Pungitius pungitius]|uniref:axin interactor, dorsalization-associated protein isoform X1 n=1 Tax=Pungitius pungitius TaxID=134920 RepID=UPI002E10AB62
MRFPIEQKGLVDVSLVVCPVRHRDTGETGADDAARSPADEPRPRLCCPDKTRPANMSEVNKTIQRWHASFRKATDFDSWGQLVEAIDEYQILARQLQKEVQSTNASDFTEEQKKTLGKIATCLEMRSASLQCTQSKEDFKLEELKKLETIIQTILTYNKVFPFDVQPVPSRKILAPGEEENLELEEEEEDGEEEEDAAAAGAGSTEAFPPRAPASQGTLLPRLPSEPGMTLLTLKIEKIGLKDAGQCIDPYMTISVKDLNGVDVNPVQDTPVACRKEDTYVHFSVDIEIQRHVEKLPKGAAIFFEFKHYKPKKRFTSTKCFAFMEMDEIKPGPIVIELYKKPTDFKRKKLQLLTKKPLYLHLHQTLHKDS